MEEFENNETQKFDINLVDFPFICRICLKRSGSRLFKVEDYLLDLYLTITKINVRSTANLPKNICNDCIKTLEDITLFVDICKYKAAISGKTFIPKNENKHVEPAKCGTSQEHVIKSEETIEDYKEDLQYFKGFEICQICYSTNILKPVEGKAHLMQMFQNITNVGEEAEVAFSKRNRICNKCINELETISLFVSVSLSNEMKLKIAVGTYEAVEIENCLEANANDVGYRNEVKNIDNYDKNAQSYESKSLHTIIDIKEEIDGTSEASIGQMSRNGVNIFTESNSEKNPFDRDPCKDVFSTGTHLKNLLEGLDINLVIQSGTNRFKCYSCDKSFTMKKNLKRHDILTHTKDRSFKCGCCENSFTQKCYLQQHMSIHSGEKQFKCDICNRSFAIKIGLIMHMSKSHEIHSREKPFKCGSCEKSFTRKDSLQRHVFIHSGEKPFKCECCERSFSLRGTLQEHMVIHSGEKPFKCGSCAKSFTRKFVLQRHMFIHSGEKPFKCECCERSFLLRGTLQKHMVIHSAEKPFKCGS